ncbi:hypothetical protein ACN077_03215 [Clostridium chromiireducens]|uniref:hypothetical protein n=1 Tax=Clostridium chromiireducens TaxID=225345 RepID=UPI003AF52765
MKKLKLKLIGIGIICVLGITAYGINCTYINYQKNKAEQAEKQAKEQLENEQRDKAIDKVKTTVNNRIIDMKCEVEYNCTSTTDDYFIITTSLKGKKDATIDCKLNRIDVSVDFDNFDSFKDTLNNYVSEEELVEVRHIAIHDYQDMLYGMASKIATWDNVHLSQNDEDYIVQETSDRFFGGERAYLVTIDSKWTTKKGTSEWKHICLHMEYNKDSKLIDAKYGDYDKIDPDKDIKNSTKVVDESTTTSTKILSDSELTVDKAKQLISNASWPSEGSEIQAFANILNDVNWQQLNGIQYITKNIIVDIDQDGVYEMLLDNGSCEANLKVSVVMYNDGNIKVEHLSTDHGGYIGYSKSKKVIFGAGGRGGYNHLEGYKLENNHCKQVYSSESNEGEVGEAKAFYTVNGQKVSKAEYDKSFKEFGEISKS